MRNLVLLRGAAGVGKSTWIKDQGLEAYTLSTDLIRLQFQAPVLDVRGRYVISQKNDHEVWDFLFALLQKRMERGEFSIVDATHSRAGTINKYKDLAQFYRYRVYVVEFDADEDVILTRNEERGGLKYVPEDAIKTMVSRIKTQPTPGWTNRLTPDEFWATFGKLNTFDFNKWSRIHHLGDIHGCVEPLIEYFNTFGYNPDEFYIFVGDYFDRGIQNVETFEFLKQFIGKPNVLFLEGNHEVHLWKWANNEEAKSKEFERVTKPQFINAGIDKGEFREFYRRLGQLAYYRFDGKTVLVTHGGLPIIPSPFTATQEMIKGVGKYEDVDIVDQTFSESYLAGNVFQVHGHRNPAMLPIDNVPGTFNLCHKVEFGGMFRAVILDRDGWQQVEIKNNTFAPNDEPIEVSTVEIDFIEQMRKSRFIQEKKLEGNISSFNFTREAFYKKEWDEITTKARGLFVNTFTKTVVARAYEKFFNLNETQETKLETLRRTMQFPAYAYVKVNGFLGIVGYDDETDSLVITSKSTTEGPFKQWFADILSQKVDLESLRTYLAAQNVSMVFEVVDPVHDPHIIEYKQPDIVLLDVIHRTFDYSKLAYADMLAVAKFFNLTAKKHYTTFSNWAEFYEWVEKSRENYDFEKSIEGVVIECADGFMFKVKFTYYNTWKMLRGLKDRVAKNRQVHTEWLINPVQNNFYAWAKQQDKEVLLNNDIIFLRKLFIADGQEA